VDLNNTGHIKTVSLVKMLCKHISVITQHVFKPAVPKFRPEGQIRSAKGSNPVRELS